MGSQTTFYPTAQFNSPAGRSSYHPYYQLDSFNELRHRLPSAISAIPSLRDGYVETTGTLHNQPDSYCGYSMPPFTHNYPFNHGQDANFQFPQGAFPYPNAYHDNNSAFNCEDLDIASMSGDDDMEGLDSNSQLRSQQLNSDGTPKRPMNAFMIFARKRRPMVSSEQPTMRTGEISKILSKEWSDMPKEDKQFYLDQAKKLKDTFNMRWPDYVYRRRPNNSRKRRKLVGASGVGPVRNGDAPSDGRVGTPADSTGANHSGDESQSQADSVSSPVGTQPKLLYPAADSYGGRSPGQISNRSPTPSVASVGYGVGSAYVPLARSKILGEHIPLDQVKPQKEFYAGGQGPYYDDLDPSDTFAPNHPNDINPQLQSWHPFNEHTPSGVVGTLTPSPPPVGAPSSQPTLNSSIPSHVYAPGTWTKAQEPSDPQTFEGSTKLWGVSPTLGDYRSMDEQGVRSVLPGEDSTLGVSHLGFRSEAASSATIPAIHPYGHNEAPLIESGHYHSAYMDAGGSAQPSHGSPSSSSSSPYERSLPILQEDSSSYVDVNSWVPGTHST